MYPAARIGDPISHDQTVPCGMIAPGAPVPCPLCMMLPVLIEGQPAAHVGCACVCSGVISGGVAHPPPPPPPAPPPPITKGSPTVLIHNQPAARWAPSLDLAACGVFLGDAKMAAMRTVLIGDIGMGAAVTTQGQAMKAAKKSAQPFCEKCSDT